MVSVRDQLVANYNSFLIKNKKVYGAARVAADIVARSQVCPGAFHSTKANRKHIILT